MTLTTDLDPLGLGEGSRLEKGSRLLVKVGEGSRVEEGGQGCWSRSGSRLGSGEGQGQGVKGGGHGWGRVRVKVRGVKGGGHGWGLGVGVRGQSGLVGGGLR